MIRRSAEASFGKIPTTRVRRLISALTRSSGLFDQIFVQWLWGERGEGAEVLLGVFEHVSNDVEATLKLACDLGHVPPSGVTS